MLLGKIIVGGGPKSKSKGSGNPGVAYKGVCLNQNLYLVSMEKWSSTRGEKGANWKGVLGRRDTLRVSATLSGRRRTRMAEGRHRLGPGGWGKVEAVLKEGREGWGGERISELSDQGTPDDSPPTWWGVAVAG